MNRREYISSVVRGGMVGALGVLSGVLVYRRQVALDPGCTNSFQCRSCMKIKKCELPEAELVRDHGEKG